MRQSYAYNRAAHARIIAMIVGFFPAARRVPHDGS